MLAALSHPARFSVSFNRKLHHGPPCPMPNKLFWAGNFSMHTSFSMDLQIDRTPKCKAHKCPVVWKFDFSQKIISHTCADRKKRQEKSSATQFLNQKKTRLLQSICKMGWKLFSIDLWSSGQGLWSRRSSTLLSGYDSITTCSCFQKYDTRQYPNHHIK